MNIHILRKEWGKRSQNWTVLKVTVTLKNNKINKIKKTPWPGLIKQTQFQWKKFGQNSARPDRISSQPWNHFHEPSAKRIGLDWNVGDRDTNDEPKSHRGPCSGPSAPLEGTRMPNSSLGRPCLLVELKIKTVPRWNLQKGDLAGEGEKSIGKVADRQTNTLKHMGMKKTSL